MPPTLWQATDAVFRGEQLVLDKRMVISRIYDAHPERPWRESSIAAHLIGLSVNHSSSHHYPTLRRNAFLFYLGNGKYRRFDKELDGSREVTTGGVQQVDSDNEGISPDARHFSKPLYLLSATLRISWCET